MSTYFNTAAQLYAFFHDFFGRLRTDASVASHILELRANLRFVITDPDAEITIDTRPPGGLVIMGPSDVPCEIVLRMSADAGHRFWLGDLGLLAAVTRREVVVERGSLTKILKLLPILKPAHVIYRQVLSEWEGRNADGDSTPSEPPRGG